MRLIDADALLKEIDGIHQRHYANSTYQFIHDFFLAMFRRIKKAPTVDAVEVVRCKDCKHFYHSISSDRDGRCAQFGTYDTDPSVYLNDFCSYGERRTEGG